MPNLLEIVVTLKHAWLAGCKRVLHEPGQCFSYLCCTRLPLGHLFPQLPYSQERADGNTLDELTILRSNTKVGSLRDAVDADLVVLVGAFTSRGNG